MTGQRAHEAPRGQGQVAVHCCPALTHTGHLPADEQIDPLSPADEKAEDLNSEGCAGVGGRLLLCNKQGAERCLRLLCWCLRHFWPLQTPTLQQPPYRAAGGGAVLTVLLPSFSCSRRKRCEIASHPSAEGETKAGAGPRARAEPRLLPQARGGTTEAGGQASCAPAAEAPR